MIPGAQKEEAASRAETQSAQATMQGGRRRNEGPVSLLSPSAFLPRSPQELREQRQGSQLGHDSRSPPEAQSKTVKLWARLWQHHLDIFCKMKTMVLGEHSRTPGTLAHIASQLPSHQKSMAAPAPGSDAVPPWGHSTFCYGALSDFTRDL